MITLKLYNLSINPYRKPPATKNRTPQKNNNNEKQKRKKHISIKEILETKIVRTMKLEMNKKFFV